MLKGRVYTFNRRENWGLGKLNDPPKVSQCRIWHIRALTWISAESMLKELDLKPRLNSLQNLTLCLHMTPHLPLWPAKSSSPSMTASQRGFQKASPGQTKLKTGERVTCEAPFQMITVWRLKSRDVNGLVFKVCIFNYYWKSRDFYFLLGRNCSPEGIKVPASQSYRQHLI